MTQPSPAEVERIRRLLCRLELQSMEGCLRYRAAAETVRNPALADMLRDFDTADQVARADFRDLLARMRQSPPRAGLVTRLRLALSGVLRPASGDRGLAKWGHAHEARRRDHCEKLVQALRRAGADPEAVQRVADIQASSLQRIDLFQQILESS